MHGDDGQKMAGKSISPPSSLVLTANATTIQHIEFILEQFFNYHIAYQWEKAREYIEHERDQFRQTSKHSILSCMLHCLTQVVVADRNYLMLQFFSSKVFQRKDSLKMAYENLRVEFQRLEEKSNQLFLKHNFHLLPFQQSSPVHGGCEFSSSSVGSEPQLFLGTEWEDSEMEMAKDALTDLVDDGMNIVPQSFSSSSPSESGIRLPTPENKSGSFFSKFLKRFSSNPVPAKQKQNVRRGGSPLVANDSFPDDSMIPVESITATHHLDSLDQYAGHICGQLVNYCRVRIDMIDFYERLTAAGASSVSKFIRIDDFVTVLSDIHQRGDDGFHHPVLTRLKIMFMFECEILLALLRSHQHIQRWRFLETLFSLQDAHNKISRLGNPREFFFGNPSATPTTIGQKPSPTSPGISNRRNQPGASLSSSGSSIGGLNLPTIKDTGNYSPMSPNNLNFIYPNVKDTGGERQQTEIKSKNLFNRSRDSNNRESPSIPLLIQWFNRYKLFLLSKYSFYFHSQLMIHLTPIVSINPSGSSTLDSTSQNSVTLNSSNSLSSLLSANQPQATLQLPSINSQTDNFIRNMCSKYLLIDFHSRIVQFVKRMPDTCTMIMILDLTGKENDISLKGYRSPFRSPQTFQGLDSFPIIYSYPGEFQLQKHPSLVMIMENRKKELNGSDEIVVEYDHHHHHQRNNIGETTTTTTGPGSPTSMVTGGRNSSTTYYLVRPDPDITLALVLNEHLKQTRNERDVQHITTFMSELGSSLKDGKILASLRTGNFK